MKEITLGTERTVLEFLDYSDYLKQADIDFRELGPFYFVGDTRLEGAYLIAISIRANEISVFLGNIISYLLKNELPFRIIKNQYEQFLLNSFIYGDDEVGKVITVICHQEKVKHHLSELKQLTNGAKGPRVRNSVLITDCLFVQMIKEINNGGESFLDMSAPDWEEYGLTEGNDYSKTLTKKGYFSAEELRYRAKGKVIKALSVKLRYFFQYVLIKEGHHYVCEDKHGRDIGHRMAWEMEILKRVSSIIRVPKVIDFFKTESSTVLVTEYIEGIQVGEKIRMLLQQTDWKSLAKNVKLELVTLFLKIVEMVRLLHHSGIIHRDINEANLILTKGDKLCFVDFELSYDIYKKMPNPHFVLGTPGYLPPEVLKFVQPTTAEDIYALGSLLMFFVTGSPPDMFLSTHTTEGYLRKISELTDSKKISAVIAECHATSPEKRPEITALADKLANCFSDL